MQRRFLIISLAGVGDTLLATPAIDRLKAAIPDAKIDCLVRWPASADILRHNKAIDDIYFLKDLCILRNRYDVSMTMFPQPRLAYGLCSLLVNAAVRIGHKHGTIADWFYTHLEGVVADRHCVDCNLDLLSRVVPYTCYLDTPSIGFSAEDYAWTHENFLVTGQKTIALASGCGNTKNMRFKRWPMRRWVELAELLDSDGWRIVFVGGAGEYRTLRTENIRRAAMAIRRCEAFVSVDCALMHVAAAVQVKNQVVIQSPAWSKSVAPYGNPYKLVTNSMVSPGELYSFDGKGIRGGNKFLIEAMESIPAESVFNAIKQQQTT